MGSPEGSYEKLQSWLIGVTVGAAVLIALTILTMLVIHWFRRRNTDDLIFTPQELSDRARVFGISKPPEASRLADSTTEVIQAIPVLPPEPEPIKVDPVKPRDPDSVKWITRFDAEIADLNARFDALSQANPERGWESDEWWADQLRSGGAVETRVADQSAEILLRTLSQLSNHQAQAVVSWVRSDWATNEYPKVNLVAEVPVSAGRRYRIETNTVTLPSLREADAR